MSKPDKNVHFKDDNNPYNDKTSINIKHSEILPIDSKFLSSDDESEVGKKPVKKIKTHHKNIFSKLERNLDLPSEIRNESERNSPIVPENS